MFKKFYTLTVFLITICSSSTLSQEELDSSDVSTQEYPTETHLPLIPTPVRPGCDSVTPSFDLNGTIPCNLRRVTEDSQSTLGSAFGQVARAQVAETRKAPISENVEHVEPPAPAPAPIPQISWPKLPTLSTLQVEESVKKTTTTTTTVPQAWSIPTAPRIVPNGLPVLEPKAPASTTIPEDFCFEFPMLAPIILPQTPQAGPSMPVVPHPPYSTFMRHPVQEPKAPASTTIPKDSCFEFPTVAPVILPQIPQVGLSMPVVPHPPYFTFMRYPVQEPKAPESATIPKTLQVKYSIYPVIATTHAPHLVPANQEMQLRSPVTTTTTTTTTTAPQIGPSMSTAPRAVSNGFSLRKPKVSGDATLPKGLYFELPMPSPTLQVGNQTSSHIQAVQESDSQSNGLPQPGNYKHSFSVPNGSDRIPITTAPNTQRSGPTKITMVVSKAAYEKISDATSIVIAGRALQIPQVEHSVSPVTTNPHTQNSVPVWRPVKGLQFNGSRQPIVLLPHTTNSPVQGFFPGSGKRSCSTFLSQTPPEKRFRAFSDEIISQQIHGKLSLDTKFPRIYSSRYPMGIAPAYETLGNAMEDYSKSTSRNTNIPAAETIEPTDEDSQTTDGIPQPPQLEDPENSEKRPEEKSHEKK